MFEYGIEMNEEHLAKLFVKREIDFNLKIKKLDDVLKVKDLLNEVYHTSKLICEEAYIFLIDDRMEVYGVVVVNAGDFEKIKIGTRLILTLLSITVSKAFFVVHNHPEDGADYASEEDISVTEAMRGLGKIFEIPCIGSYIIQADKMIMI